MKHLPLITFILILIVLSLTIDRKNLIGNTPKCYNYKTILNVEPQHATRILVTYITMW